MAFDERSDREGFVPEAPRQHLSFRPPRVKRVLSSCPYPKKSVPQKIPSKHPRRRLLQVEGGFVQGLGWTCIEELVWGDKEHEWVRPGTLHTRGPGARPLLPGAYTVSTAVLSCGASGDITILPDVTTIT